jgi:hypothetical protein
MKAIGTMILSEQARYRWEVTARAIAAIFGGYLLTATATTLMAVLLPVSRADAVIIGTMLSFALYACAVMWVFAVRSALHAWCGILGVTGLLAILLWLYRSMQ